MKLTVKRKVANGLVVGFMLPHAAGVFSEALDMDIGGLNAFAADDDFDISAPQGGSSEIMVAVADPCDPSGVDSSGVDTMCFDPSGGLPTLCVRAPTELVTTEDGAADFFEVYAASDPSDPSGSQVYYFQSDRPWEAKPITEAVVIGGPGQDSCEPESVWIGGQNDPYLDDDQKFEIEVISPLGYVEATVPGVNLDNDSGIDRLYIDVSGPSSLPVGDSGIFDVLVGYWGDDPTLSGNDLLIEASAGLEIGNYAVSGGSFKGKPRVTRSGALLLQKVELKPQEPIIVSIEVEMVNGGQTPQKINAHFVNSKTGYGNDDSLNVRTSLR